MKNIFTALVVVLIIGVSAWYFTSSQKDSAQKSASNNPANTTDAPSLPGETGSASLQRESNTDIARTEDEESDELEEIEEDIKPATEIYKSADEAMEALRNASKSYDDSVLEQFAEPDPSCTWCEPLYANLSTLIFSPDTTADEKSYYAEVLAISGRVNNIKTLVEGIRNSQRPEDADIYAEALELAIGKDDVTSYLGSQLGNANDSLRESLIAAITNQSSRLAAETLYKNTVERGDADGYYSSGIGLGEFIPDEEALPFLREAVVKRDQYSHLATKALLNSGADGLRMVLDTLESSKDPEFDRRMLKDAIDHVSYDEEVEELLKSRLATAKQPAAREFIEESLKSFSGEDEDYEETDEDL